MRFILWLAAVVILIAILFVGLTDAYGHPSQGGNATFVLLARSTLGNKLPSCYGPSCVGKLAELHVWIRTGSLSYGDAELFVNGQTYHTLVWRIKVDSDWYAWAFQGHPIWWKAVDWFAQQHPSDTAGPSPWRGVEGLAPAQCQAVAQAALINVRSDAGTLIPPAPSWTTSCAEAGPVAPSDAGSGQDACHQVAVPQSWPDGGVVTCGGQGFWLARSRHGGTWGSDPAPGPLPVAVDAGAPQPAYYNEAEWESPDAAVTKTCFNVPIGEACP